MTDNGSGSSATYSYLANSPLVGQIAFANGGQTRMTTTKQYDYLNRLTSISSVPSAAAVVSFAYQYNSANQRTAVTGNDGSYWTYGYDPLGQVTNGFKSWADTTLVAGEQFQYGFDTIGNRTSTAAGGDSSGAGLRTANYHANLLNQYTNRDVPGAFDVLGLALATNTTVAVNGQTPYRKSEFFRQQLSVTNTSSAVWQSVSVTATNAGTTTGNVFVAQTPEQFTYDLDGNLTGDGHWSYTWDAENRLIGMTNIASTAPAQGLVFGYDWKWRRVQKQVWCNGSLTNNSVLAYDGWNLMARLNATNSGLAQSYLWGLDLSGSPQGAGGVGGLLEISDSLNGGHFAAFDGNGNVAGLVTAGTGTNSAAYEYAPFGELLRATGPIAKANTFRFSTKYQDDETDLTYYGYRFYATSNGKWVNRDPIAERGGNNLYAFLGNAPPTRFDKLGLIYDLQIAPPSGIWVLNTHDMAVENDKLGTLKIMGFYSRYIPSDGKHGSPACPCSPKQIVLVQVVKDPMNHGTQFDTDAGVGRLPAHKADDQVPEYAAAGNLTIRDAPYYPDAPNTSGSWSFEDCAICRTHPDAQTTKDLVLGCVTFTFHRTDQRTASIIRGGSIQAGAPSSMWMTALQDWVTRARPN